MLTSSKTSFTADITDTEPLKPDATYDVEETRIDSYASFRKRSSQQEQRKHKVPKRHNKFLSHGHVTLFEEDEPRKKVDKSFYQQIIDKVKKLDTSALWHASATTWVFTSNQEQRNHQPLSPLQDQLLYSKFSTKLIIYELSSTLQTRNSSPSHAIPKATRFTSLEEDRRRNGQFLTLQLRKDLTRGIAFPKSTRKERFANPELANTPSGATHAGHRFLDNSSYHTNTNSPRRPLTGYQNFELDEKQAHSSTLEHTPNGQETLKKWTSHEQTHAKTLQVREFRFDELKGRTFGKASNYNKLFLKHGQHLPYHECFTQDNPGVGQYSLRTEAGADKPKFTMRKILTRFNQKLGQNLLINANHHQIQATCRHSPGPADYNTAVRPRSCTVKTTFTLSRRLDMRKPVYAVNGPKPDYSAHYLQHSAIV